MKIEEAIDIIDKELHKKWDKKVEKKDGMTYIHLGDEEPLNEFEKASQRCLVEVQSLNREIERLNYIIEKLEERCKFFNEIANEKQNRIDRCMTFNNYILHENWYGGNEKKYAQRNINILQGKETELKEIPRVGSDKEC